MNTTPFTLNATGEKVAVIRTSPDGGYVEFLVSLPKGGDGPPLHIHTRQTETFHAVEGQLGIQAGDQKIILDPGESHRLLAGIPHSFFNPNDFEMTFKVSFTPALNMQWFGREMIKASNRNGGNPKALENAFILWKMRKEYQLAGESFWQRLTRPFLVLLTIFTNTRQQIDMHGFQKVDDRNKQKKVPSLPKFV
jgi:quercetin dioxygenase-like cupin family protein